jgi:hypothetical protein
MGMSLLVRAFDCPVGLAVLDAPGLQVLLFYPVWCWCDCSKRGEQSRGYYGFTCGLRAGPSVHKKVAACYGARGYTNTNNEQGALSDG